MVRANGVEKARSMSICLVIGLTILKLLYVITMVLTDNFFYAINDDSTMAAILGGRYGGPSEYAVFIHILLGKLLKQLYIWVPRWNWLSFLYLVVLFSGAIFSEIAILKSKSINRYVKGWLIVAFECSFLVTISYFSFTVVSAWAYICGTIIYVVTNKDGDNLAFWRIIVGIFVLFGALIRPETYVLIGIIFASYVMIKLVKNKDKAPLIFMVICAFAMIISIKSNAFICNQNQTQKDYIEWTKLRSKVFDYEIADYQSEKFEELGISKAQYDAFNAAFFYVKDAVDTDYLNKILDLTIFGERYNTNVLDIVKHHIEKFRYVIYYEYFNFVLFVFAAILALYLSKSKIEVLLVWLSTLAVETILEFIKRDMYKVHMPAFLFGALMLLLVLAYNCEDDLTLIKRRVINSAVIMLAVLCLGQRFFTYRLYSNRKEINSREAVVNYIHNNPDTVYLAANGAVYQLETASSAIKNYALEGGCLLGNWEIYSVPHYDICNARGIKNPDSLLEESINNESILYISTFEDVNKSCSYIIDLAKQYYDIDCHFEEVESISEYRDYHWAVYRLVAEE